MLVFILASVHFLQNQIQVKISLFLKPERVFVMRYLSLLVCSVFTRSDLLVELLLRGLFSLTLPSLAQLVLLERSFDVGLVRIDDWGRNQ